MKNFWNFLNVKINSMKSQVETGRCSKDLLLRKRSFADMILESAKEKKNFKICVF